MQQSNEIQILTEEEYKKLREEYIYENLFKPKLRPFFQTRFPVVKNYIYYDNPVIITEDANSLYNI